MHVELSSAAQDHLQSLVADGSFASIESAIEAAVLALPFEGLEHLDFDELHRRNQADIAAGRVFDATPEFMANVRARAEARIRAGTRDG